MRTSNREWGAVRAAVTAAALAVLAACGGGGSDGVPDAAASASATAAPDAHVLALSIADAVPQERYVLVNEGSGQCIEAKPATGDGGSLQQAACTQGLNQAFDVTRDTAGRYKLVSAGSGRVIDLAGSSGADGATLHQWTDNGTLAQRFLLSRTHGNRFSLANAGSRKCVAIATDGMLRQAVCADAPSQQFRLHPQASGGRSSPALGQYNLRSVHSRLCLEIEGGSSADGARPLQADCGTADAQRHDLVSTGDGAYRIVNARSGKVLEVNGGATGNGAVVQQGADGGGAHQRFVATAVGDAFLMQARHSGKCVDVAAFSTAVGGIVHQWDCTRNNNQLWQLVPASDEAPPATGTGKSAKRGVAYDLATSADMAALSPGVSWWYNWSPRTNAGAPADAAARYGMDFVPMLWNGNFNDAEVESLIKANARIQYLLVLNEPNLSDQANITPAQAAALWPRYETLAARTGVKIVGPAITWGTVAGFEDPVVWLDAFYAAYRAANAQRDPRIDYLAFHWYDYGLGGQLDRLKKYNKPFWVTEFANWHGQNDGAQIDTLDKQKAQMTDMVATCEGRADVFRYAWFTGRWNNDTHFSSLLAADGQLTGLGAHYLSLPVQR